MSTPVQEQKTSGGFWESRTGWSRLKHTLLLEPLPGGSRWAAAFGSLLLFTFPVAGSHGHLAGDELRPGRQDRLAKRQIHPGAIAAGMVHPRVAPLGCQRHDHSGPIPFDPGVCVGGLQAAARIDLDGRRVAVDMPGRPGIHRLSAALGRKGLLGDSRRLRDCRHGAMGG